MKSCNNSHSQKAAMIDQWRKHFVLAESMLEMECTCLTPAVVLQTSGHVERFTDLMVKDPETGECFRADKLLEDAIDVLIESSPDMPKEEREDHLRIQRQADAYSPEEIDDLLANKYNCKAPSGQPYSNAFPFNLMFKTSIGPEGTAVGYLRPETAQGLFVNFRRLLDANAGKMPFAAAQIGLGFRNGECFCIRDLSNILGSDISRNYQNNSLLFPLSLSSFRFFFRGCCARLLLNLPEIAPRAGLLRVREFCMGEIEHFVNPDDKSHPSFPSVAAKELILFGSDDQLGSGKTKTVTIGEAVKSGLVNNETLGYFMARTQLFMEKIGMDPARMRFRQHLKTEMAHYACDCWDLEIQSSYGWVECVGHADRACYDLEVHSKKTKTPMLATQRLDAPKEIEFAKLKFDRKALGKAFRQDQRVVSGALEALAESWATFEPIATALETDGKTAIDGFEVTKDMFTWTKATKTVSEIKFTPSVIEPSFGMGRILYSLLEHSFYQREGDEQRIVMKFKPAVAPNKCAVLPISSSPEVNDVVDEIAAELMESDLSTRVDKSTAALGRRYARSDELGVPFAVTVDFDTLKDDTVTVRERDSMVQIRLAKSEVTKLMFDIVHGRTTWEDAAKTHRIVQVSEDGETANAEGATTVVEGTIRGKFSRPAEKI